MDGHAFYDPLFTRRKQSLISEIILVKKKKCFDGNGEVKWKLRLNNRQTFVFFLNFKL